MTKQELINKFITILNTDNGIEIWVETIHWNGPHTPVSKKDKWLELKPESTEKEAEQSIDSLLGDTDYFGFCVECREHNPAGWMHEVDLCQSCAERNHRVVY